MTTVRRLGIASVLLVAFGASIAYYATTLALRNGHGESAQNVPWVALVFIAALAAGGVMAFWKTVQRDINTISSQMDTMAKTGKIGLVMLESTGELNQIVKPLNEFLTMIRRQTEDLRVENRELQIQFRVAAAEKHNTEAIIFSISDAVIVTNRFDELILANEAAEKLLGFKLTPSLRKNIDQIISNGTLVRLIRETRSNGRNITRKVVEHCIDQKGSPRTFNITLSCVAAPADEVSGVVAVLHDVTREKEIARIKTDFVSNVSHELKTPLSSIKAYIEMLLDGEAQDEKTTKEFYEIISFETDRLHRLIENILNISRIESGVVKVVREPISLTSVVKQVLDVAVIQAKSKNIRLTDSLAPVYYQIEADRDMIYQAVLNLLSNAIKYTPEDGSVNVTVNVDERRKVAVCEVSDTGAGIPVDDLPKIFDKFYRVRANEKMAKGTGLGLALVKHIVETVHDGKLTVTSEEGKGSTFAFELPIIV
ncbi:MAG: cell wall metabolism sensor histidine kinase WalK [Planctomycetes bacterium]|nr:cell wall metabolism sensor histidine kinase WalK [Planctomycetota bacterium]